MPSTKKRINLTVPDNIYERLQVYKTKNGIENDASACLQLIVRQLDGQEQTESMLKLINNTSVENLLRISQEGFSTLKGDLSK